jgi:hypothetical protein
MNYRLVRLDNDPASVSRFAEVDVGSLSFAEGRALIRTDVAPLRLRLQEIFAHGTTIEGTGSEAGAQTVTLLQPGDDGFADQLSAQLIGRYVVLEANE